MRVLITGSSGQIGTNLGFRLLAMGHDVFGVDVRPNPLQQGIHRAVAWCVEWWASNPGDET